MNTPWIPVEKEVISEDPGGIPQQSLAEHLRAALTDDVLKSIGGDALISRDASQSSYWNEIREGIVSAVTGESR